MTTHKIEAYLAQAIAGSLIGAIAARRNLDITELADPRSTELRALSDELCTMGIYPQVIAHHTLSALSALLCEPENADTVVTNLTSLLWTILGDPENGGSPPELYRRAGYAMHVTLLGLLCPSIIDPSLHD